MVLGSDDPLARALIDACGLDASRVVSVKYEASAGKASIITAIILAEHDDSLPTIAKQFRVETITRV